MPLITSDDFIETYLKIKQRGYRYIFSKLNLSNNKRAKGTFNDINFESSNYWIVPKIRERWNQLISGDKTITYEQYFSNKYLKNKKGLTLLSMGSGTCSHEITFAKQTHFSRITCVDFAEKPLQEAKIISAKLGIFNIDFINSRVNDFIIAEKAYDVILFHSSLHHFKKIPELLARVSYGLKDDGLLLINDYVGPNRLQLHKYQKKEINDIIINTIPAKYKKRLFSKMPKKKISGPGLLRMIITDPSEAVESKTICPSIYQLFEVVEEKKTGGDLLMWVFKDIAHNFTDDNPETNQLLETIFSREDEYLKNHESGFIFGIYKKK